MIKATAKGNLTSISLSLTKFKAKEFGEIAKDLRPWRDEVVKLARAKAPRKTGALAKSIRGRIRRKRGEIEVVFNWAKSGRGKKRRYYGGFVEWGVKSVNRGVAQPHLRPAFDEKSKDLEEVLLDSIIKTWGLS